MRRFLVVLALLFGTAVGGAYGQDWGGMATISSTMGVQANRLCVGEATRGDIGCPTYAPSLTTAGDVALTGGLTTSSVSLTTLGTTWGYLGAASSYIPNLASNAISTTNISLTTINGLPYTGVGSSTLPVFRATKGGTNQSIATTTYTDMTWSTKDIDTASTFNTSNGRFTPNVAGYYSFHLAISCSGMSSGSQACVARILKNGTPITQQVLRLPSGDSNANANVLVYMNGATDYVTAQGYSEAPTAVISGSPLYTYFEGVMVGNGSTVVSGTGGGASMLSQLTDVSIITPVSGSVLTYNASNSKWEALAATGGLGYAITSGTTAVTVNSDTAIISLTTAGTTWGYLSSAGSYLPKLTTGSISTTTVQVSGTTAVCGSTNAGTIRYTSATTTLELCTGTGWQPIGVGIPAGTISAFASTTCPTGWSEYTAARGRFLRGIDNGAGNDPDGTRAPGATQADMVGPHNHQLNGNYIRGGTGTSANLTNGGGSFAYSIPYDYTTNNTGTETRAKNVAVTFCQFNGTSNGWNNPLSGGSTTPGGSTGQIQYNTSGSFDANAGLTWTNATQTLFATNISTTNISATTINGIAISSLGSGASPTNVPAFRVTKGGTAQTVSAGVMTKLTFSTKDFDTFNNFSTSTNRFTPTVAGNYLIAGSVYCSTAPASTCYTAIYKNGTAIAQSGIAGSSGSSGVVTPVLAVIPMNGSTDYLELYGQSNDTQIGGGIQHTNFSGSLLASGNGTVSGTGATALSALTDVNVAGVTSGSILVYDAGQAKWVSVAANSANGYAITSGTTSVTANSATSLVSLSTAGTTWGYLSSAASYLPNFSSNAISTTNISLTTINGQPLNSFGSASPTNVPAFRASLITSNQTVSANVWTKVGLNNKNFDTYTNFSLGTGRFTPTIAGYYYIAGNVACGGTGCYAGIYKNGALYSYSGSNNTTSPVSNASTVLYMNGSTDYIELYGYTTSTAFAYSDAGTYLTGSLVASGNGLISSTGAGVSAMSSLTDVTLTSPVANSVLVYDGTKWVNKFLQDTVSSTSMLPGWPDAIQCDIGGVSYTFYYRTPGQYFLENGSNYWYALYANNTTATATYSTTSSTPTYCDTHTIPQMYAAGRAFNFLGGNGINAGLGYALTSGTLSVTANSNTSIVSLTTNGTTWGYLGNTSSYIPNLASNAISTTNISATTINGIAISNLGGSASATNVPSFRVHKNGTNQTVTAGTNTALTWSTKVYDNMSAFNLGTGRYTPTVAGKYLFHAQVYCPDGATTYCQLDLRKNGTSDAIAHARSSVGDVLGSVNAIIDMNGTTDYVELYITNAGGTTIRGTASSTFFEGSLIASGNGLTSSSTAGVSALASLTDVSVSTPANNSLLRYNTTSSKWESVDINAGVSTTTIVAGWPDAIRCNVTSPLAATAIFLNGLTINSGGNVTYSFQQGSSRFQFSFTSAKTYTSSDYYNGSSWTTFTSDCDSKPISQLYAEGKAFNFIGNNGGASTAGLGYALTSGTLAVTANSTTSIVSLTTGVTTWGYFGSTASYLPNFSSNAISTTNISVTTINGQPLSSFGGSASPTNVPAFRVTKGGTDQSIATSTGTKLTWSTKIYDTYNSFNTSTGRFTPTVAGYYLIYLNVGCNGTMTSGQACSPLLYKNGTSLSSSASRSTAGQIYVGVSDIVYLNGSTDYIEAYGYNEGSSAAIMGSQTQTYFTGTLIASGNGLISGTGAGVSSMASLTDVTLTNPSATSILVYDGSKWVNKYIQDTVSTTTMYAGYPDAISCARTDGGYNLFYLLNTNVSGDVMYGIVNSNSWTISFNGTTGKYSTSAGTSIATYISAASGQCLNTNTTLNQLYASGQAFNFLGTNAAATGLGYSLTSGTLAVTANSNTSIVSLSTAGTTWGYLGSAASYLPKLTTGSISTTTVQVSGTTATCDSSVAGTIRYTSATTTLELCTGTAWQPIGVGIPAGTISAFASTTCPTGWSEYTAARGRFLRGIDNGAGNDPSGTRVPGNTQDDTFQSHIHVDSNVLTNATAGWNMTGGGGQFYTGPVAVSSSTPRTDGTSGAPRTSSETRPRNVAVTFCQFNGTSNGWNNPLSGGSSSAAGSTSQIQYNTSGSFDASSFLTWANATQTLTATNISATNLTVNGVAITGSGGLGYALTSGTLSVTANSSSSTVSLTTVSTTWGYLGSSGSYLPNLSSNAISATTINGVSVSSYIFASSSIPAFNVNKGGTTQTIGASTWTKITFSNKVLDTQNNFSTATSRFTPTVAGNYIFTGSIYCGSAQTCWASVYKNGVITTQSGNNNNASTNGAIPTTSIILPMNGTTDYVELYTYSNSTSIYGNIEYTGFSGSLLGGVGSSSGTSGTGTGVSALSSLTDVTLTNPSPSSILQYDGSKWVNKYLQDTVSTTTMVTGWPDALTCSGTGGVVTMIHFYTASSLHYYRLSGSDAANQVVFNNDGTYNSSAAGGTFLTTCTSKTISQLYASGQAFNFIGTNAGINTDYALTSGTLAVTANSNTSVVSLTTGLTTWGYFASTGSYLPNLSSNAISTTNISVTTINGISVSALGGGSASPTNVPSFRVNRNGVNQTATNNGYTKIMFTTKEFDTMSNFDTTNSKFQPTIAGNYIFNANAYCGVAATTCYTYVYKNGAGINMAGSSSVTDSIAQSTAIIPMNGTTDYVEAYVYMSGNTTLNGTNIYTNFAGSLLASGNGLISASTAGVSAIASLTDVSLTSLSPTSVLMYDGTKWVNKYLQDSVSSTTMLTGWPDAIYCAGTSGGTFLYHTYNYTPSGTQDYFPPTGSTYRIQFTSTGAFSMSAGSGYIESCINKTVNQLYASGQAFNFLGGTSIAPNLDYALTSGTLAVTANSNTSIVSLTTGLTTWGYFGSTGSYLPNFSSNAISTTNISATTINGIPVSSLGSGGTASPTNVPAFRVNKGGTAQTVTTATWTKLTWSTKEFDTLTNFDTTNSRFQPTVAGNYIFNLEIQCASVSAYCQAGIYKNGVLSLQNFNRVASTTSAKSSLTVMLSLNGTTDYVEAYGFLSAGTSVDGTATSTTFQGSLLASGNGLAGGGSGVSAMSSLTDVTLTSPISNSMLVYDGTKWVNKLIQDTVSTSTMVNTWPDAILCTINGTTDYIFPMSRAVSGGSALYKYESGSTVWTVAFSNISANGDQSGSSTAVTNCTTTVSSLYASGRAFNFIGGNGAGGLGYAITSGTLAVTANSNTSIISLTTAGTTWGYMGSTGSYVPNLGTSTVSATAVSATSVKLNDNAALACASATYNTIKFVNNRPYVCVPR